MAVVTSEVNVKRNERYERRRAASCDFPHFLLAAIKSLQRLLQSTPNSQGTGQDFLALKNVRAEKVNGRKGKENCIGD